MTAPRRDGNGSRMGEWIRINCKESTEGLYVTDTDWMFHQWKTDFSGRGYKSRLVRCMMCVEEKSHGAEIDDQQRETLFLQHQLLRNIRTGNKSRRDKLVSTIYGLVSVHHFGYYCLRLSGLTPDDSEWIKWCRFDNKGVLLERDVNSEELTRMLNFESDPDSPGNPLKVRRHHLIAKEVISDPNSLFGWSEVTKRS